MRKVRRPRVFQLRLPIPRGTTKHKRKSRVGDESSRNIQGQGVRT